MQAWSVLLVLLGLVLLALRVLRGAAHAGRHGVRFAAAGSDLAERLRVGLRRRLLHLLDGWLVVVLLLLPAHRDLLQKNAPRRCRPGAVRLLQAEKRIT